MANQLAINTEQCADINSREIDDLHESRVGNYGCEIEGKPQEE